MKTIQVKEVETITTIRSWKVTDEVFNAIQENPSEVATIMQEAAWDDTQFVSMDDKEKTTKRTMI